MRALRTTVLGGALFLLPLAAVLLLLGQAFRIGRRVAQPAQDLTGMHGPLGLLLADALALLLLVALCYAAGLIARTAFAAGLSAFLEERVLGALPGYVFARSVLRNMAGAEAAADDLTPVLLRAEGLTRIAFEVERGPAGVVLYLPNAPTPWTGTTVIAPPEAVSPLDMPAADAFDVVKRLGRGAGEALARRRPRVS